MPSRNAFCSYAVQRRQHRLKTALLSSNGRCPRRASSSLKPFRISGGSDSWDSWYARKSWSRTVLQSGSPVSKGQVCKWYLSRLMIDRKCITSKVLCDVNSGGGCFQVADLPRILTSNPYHFPVFWCYIFLLLCWYI